MNETILVTTEIQQQLFLETFENNKNYVVLDTETTGLSIFKNHAPFSFQILIPTPEEIKVFYFNLNNVAGPRTPSKIFKRCIAAIAASKKTTLIAHNAKFDLLMSAALDIEYKCLIWDTMVAARLIKNNLPTLKLDYLAKKYLTEEFHKDDELKKWTKQKSNKELCSSCKITKNGTLKYDTLYAFIPFDIMFKYAAQDVVATWYLFLAQWQEISYYKEHEPAYAENLIKNISMEQRFTKILYHMEKRGILTDREYIDKAIDYEENLLNKDLEEYKNITKENFKDSSAVFDRLLKALYNISLPTGKPSEKLGICTPKADEEILNAVDVPLTSLIIKIRKRSKRLETYFKNIRDMAGDDNVLHPIFNQVGAKTLRLSSSSPNSQNMPARGEDDQAFPVRGCFIPRKGYKFCSIDFSAQEVRLILDLSGEKKAIEEILAGKDPHKANAEIAGCSRIQAKTVIFSILYGSGDTTLADQLKVSLEEARRVKRNILSELPALKAWSDRKNSFAEEQGVTHNCFGVRYHWDGQGDKFYAATNYDIQGGSAYITKYAGIAIDDLKQKNSFFKDIHIVIQIHDEYLIEVPEHFTLQDCDVIAKAMCTAYEPSNGLPMDAEPEIMDYRWKK